MLAPKTNVVERLYLMCLPRKHARTISTHYRNRCIHLWLEL